MRAICMTQIALLSPFAYTGGSKISFTTRAMSRYAKTHRAFEKFRASSQNSKLRLQYSPVQSIRHNPARPLRRRSRRSQIHIFYDLQ